MKSERRTIRTRKLTEKKEREKRHVWRWQQNDEGEKRVGASRKKIKVIELRIKEGSAELYMLASIRVRNLVLQKVQGSNGRASGRNECCQERETQHAECAQVQDEKRNMEY